MKLLQQIQILTNMLEIDAVVFSNFNLLMGASS